MHLKVLSNRLYNDPEYLEELLDSQPSEFLKNNEEERTLVFYLVEDFNLQCLKTIAQKRPELLRKIDNHGETLIHSLIKIRSVNYEAEKELLELLVENGVDINVAEKFRGDTPLHLAVSNHDVEMVRELIKLGANVNKSSILTKERAELRDKLTFLLTNMEDFYSNILSGILGKVDKDELRTTILKIIKDLDTEKPRELKKPIKNLFDIFNITILQLCAETENNLKDDSLKKVYKDAVLYLKKIKKEISCLCKEVFKTDGVKRSPIEEAIYEFLNDSNDRNFDIFKALIYNEASAQSLDVAEKMTRRYLKIYPQKADKITQVIGEISSARLQVKILDEGKRVVSERAKVKTHHLSGIKHEEPNSKKACPDRDYF